MHGQCDWLIAAVFNACTFLGVGGIIKDLRVAFRDILEGKAAVYTA